MDLSGCDILIVEDETLLRKRLAASLENMGAEVTAVDCLADGRNALDGLDFEFALIDVNLPDGIGLDLLREGRFSPNTGVVVMTADGGVKTAVEAIRVGAGDYLTKPFDVEELPLVFHRCRRARQSSRLEEHRRESVEPEGESIFFGDSLAELKGQLDRIIATDHRLGSGLPPVLIEGETGTGKTSVARWLHHNGPRSGLPLVEVNCSALPENLAESELFGHERGAFTDARTARIGLFEAADGGTLFLDEIPSLALGIQAKVLTAIEDGRVRRVGGNSEKTVNVRLVAASNANLKQLVGTGSFREDLYHRLDLLRLRMPALRERGNDILHLTRHLVSRLARKYRRADTGISDAGRERLLAYTWPGNVRELANEIERAIVLGTSDEFHFEHLPGTSSGPDSERLDRGILDDWFNEAWRFPERGFSLDQAIDRIVLHALKQCADNVSEAARILGVSRDQVRYRLKNIKT